MPTYEYICGECRKKFAVAMSFAAHEKSPPKCPKCKSRKVHQRFTPFFSKTSRKS